MSNVTEFKTKEELAAEYREARIEFDLCLELAKEYLDEASRLKEKYKLYESKYLPQ